MATPTNLPASFSPGDVLTAANMNDIRGAFRILQVVNTQLITQVGITGGFADITGFSASITPQATSSKVLAVVNATLGGPSGATVGLRLLRGSTAIGQPTAGTVTNGNTFWVSGGIFQMASVTFEVLDSPSTTSATTYKVQGYTDIATAYVNRRNNDANFGATSSITLYEVSA